MQHLSTDGSFDNSIALLADPYRFVSRECVRRGADLFETRIALEPTVFMTGPHAAEVFYDTERFTREGAAPEPLRATLFGNGGVQTLDGAAHRHRKAMFMSLMSAEAIAALVDRVVAAWDQAASEWADGSDVTLYDAAHDILTRAVCGWTGVALREDEVAERTRQLVTLFDQAGAKGFGHLRARLARKRAEAWIADVIRRIRAGALDVARDTAAYCVAMHREPDGTPLAPETAAVELLNVLRPTVAISVFVVHAAHALHHHPLWVQRLRDGGEDDARRFALEVRRAYPFFPSVIARVRRDFDWAGHRFSRGTRVILDLYGTNHDERAWEAPHEFRPDRFLARAPTPFDMIPQGGGDFGANHRCPGEWITEEVLIASIGFLTRAIAYDVPEQDLRIDFARLPAIPCDRFVIRNVGRLI